MAPSSSPTWLAAHRRLVQTLSLRVPGAVVNEDAHDKQPAAAVVNQHASVAGGEPKRTPRESTHTNRPRGPRPAPTLAKKSARKRRGADCIASVCLCYRLRPTSVVQRVACRLSVSSRRSVNCRFLCSMMSSLNAEGEAAPPTTARPGTPSTPGAATTKRPRGATEAASLADGDALAGPALKAPREAPRTPAAFRLWHYDGDVRHLFHFEILNGLKVAWCRLCKDGPLSTGHGGVGHLFSHLNGKKHAAVRPERSARASSCHMRALAADSLGDLVAGPLGVPQAFPQFTQIHTDEADATDSPVRGQAKLSFSMPKNNVSHLRAMLPLVPLLSTWVVATGVSLRLVDHEATRDLCNRLMGISFSERKQVSCPC